MQAGAGGCIPSSSGVDLESARTPPSQASPGRGVDGRHPSASLRHLPSVSGLPCSCPHRVLRHRMIYRRSGSSVLLQAGCQPPGGLRCFVCSERSACCLFPSAACLCVALAEVPRRELCGRQNFPERAALFPFSWPRPSCSPGVCGCGTPASAMQRTVNSQPRVLSLWAGCGVYLCDSAGLPLSMVQGTLVGCWVFGWWPHLLTDQWFLF